MGRGNKKGASDGKEDERFWTEARRGQNELSDAVDPNAGKNAKQVAREKYKMLGNKKEKGKTEKGGTNHWTQEHADEGW